jgi:hypothetical protein
MVCEIVVETEKGGNDLDEKRDFFIFSKNEEC